MSGITLEMLLDAATSTLPQDATNAEIGQLVADLVVKFDAESKPATIARKRTPAKARKASKPASKAPTMKANWNGQMMKAGKGTATKNQKQYLLDHGMSAKTVATISMVAASDIRAKLSGKI